jgi:2-polyprenyl-3-methyl-5-hydroxy-6-metoxy-1,4-benzoquinol methylase
MKISFLLRKSYAVINKKSKMKTFKETDIRPQDLMKGQQIAMLADVGRLLERRKDFVDVDCPACGSSEKKKVFEKYGMEYVQCNVCETIYITPRPTAEVLEWFYKDSVNYAYWNKYIFPASDERRRERIFVPRVDAILKFCEKYQIEMHSLLEVGAAFGTFCVEMKSRNCFKQIVGVEPTPNLAQTCREKGVEVIEKTIEEISFPEAEKFNVVVNFEVIEHLFSPKDFLLQCKKLLKPNGLFVVTCPNGKGFDVVVLGEKSVAVDHEHLNYFNPKSLTRLLESCGFEILEVETPGKLDAELVRNKVISGEFDLVGQPFLKQILLENWENLHEPFQKFISENGLSSNMWIVARNT